METIETINKHRTIRKYTDKPISEETVINIVKAGQRAPSACSLQSYAIIWVKDEDKRKKIWASCGKQDWILEAPVMLTICADIRKSIKMMNSLGLISSFEKGLGIRWKIFSIIDAILVAQNMTIAAESLGLGSIYIGGAIANERVIRTLDLPKGVFPLSLLCIGWPDEEPMIRPRLPISNILFVDKYKDLTKKEYKNSIQHMVEKFKEENYYFKYGIGSKEYTWIDNLKSKLTPNIKDDEKLKNILKKIGFTFDEPITL
jgi:nitroreductase